MKKTLYSLMLNDEVVREVDALAHRMSTNRSNLINQILAEYVNYTTPERRINDVLSTIQELMSPSHDFVPFFAPIGLGFWQIAVALIAGISAKEVVVSSTAVLFGINNINSTQGMHALSGVLQGMGFGALNAYCLMIFCLLYIPCIATLATIHKESRSWKWTGLTILFQMATAWVLTFVVYQVGLLL